MDTIKVFENDQKEIWILHDPDAQETHYGVIMFGPFEKHWCGYLNVTREKWHVVDEALRDQHQITFESIESTRLSIPAVLYQTVPTPVRNFWIGIDYAGIQPQPTSDEIVSRLGIILRHYNVLLSEARIV